MNGEITGPHYTVSCGSCDTERRELAPDLDWFKRRIRIEGWSFDAGAWVCGGCARYERKPSLRELIEGELR